MKRLIVLFVAFTMFISFSGVAFAQQQPISLDRAQREAILSAIASIMAIIQSIQAQLNDLIVQQNAGVVSVGVSSSTPVSTPEVSTSTVQQNLQSSYQQLSNVNQAYIPVEQPVAQTPQDTSPKYNYPIMEYQGKQYFWPWWLPGLPSTVNVPAYSKTLLQTKNANKFTETYPASDFCEKGIDVGYVGNSEVKCPHNTEKYMVSSALKTKLSNCIQGAGSYNMLYDDVIKYGGIQTLSLIQTANEVSATAQGYLVQPDPDWSTVFSNMASSTRSGNNQLYSRIVKEGLEGALACLNSIY